MINLQIHHQIALAFDEGYNKRDLEKEVRPPIRRFIKKNRDFCEQQGVPEHLLDLILPNTLSKTMLVHLVAIPFLNKALFEAFKATLPEDVQQLFDELIWRENLSHQEIEDQWSYTIYEKQEKRWNAHYAQTTFELKDKYKIFKYSSGSRYSYSTEPNFIISLLPDLRKIVSHYYDTPADAKFNPIAAIEQTEHIFSGEETILMELPRIFAYAGQHQIKMSKKWRVVPSTVGKMQRKLKLKEFYSETEQKNLKSLRTYLLANLVTAVNNKAIGTVAEQIHYFIQQDYRKRFNQTVSLFPHLKGTGYVDSDYLNNLAPTMYDTFRKLPLNEWISFNNFENYFKYNFLEVKPISEWIAEDKLHYVVETSSDRFSFKEKLYINKSKYYQAIVLPYLKGTCYLFAAFGLLDVAYDTPNMEELGRTAASPFDGLKYLKLTALGAFVTAKTDTYKAPSSLVESTIRLSDDSLTIVVDEADTTAPVILEPYAQRVSPNRFQTDYGIFLKGVTNKTQLDNKINLFKNSIKVKIPANWEQFFKELKQKIDPLRKVGSVRLFQIPADNPELLRLIAKDAQLQKLCLKAEGCHVIVKNKDFANFKKRLQEFGYLMA